MEACNILDNQQANLKKPSHLLHYTTQRTRARLFLERGAAFFPSFELELILSRQLWERGGEGGASLEKEARGRALCGVMQ